MLEKPTNLALEQTRLWEDNNREVEGMVASLSNSKMQDIRKVVMNRHQLHCSNQSMDSRATEVLGNINHQLQPILHKARRQQLAALLV